MKDGRGTNLEKSQNFIKSQSIFIPEQNVPHLEVVCATFYMPQTIGACAGMCMCDQMEKPAQLDYILNN